MTIEQGNKLIAEFMEYERCTDPDHVNDPCFIVPLAKGYHKVKDMQHHASWDWLMPVVEKVESLGYETGVCSVDKKGVRLSEVLISPVSKGGNVGVHQMGRVSKMQLIWECVVDFIIAYNQFVKP